MKISDKGVYKVKLSTGVIAEFPVLKQMLIYVWDNLDNLSSVSVNGKTVRVGDYLWKK